MRVATWLLMMIVGMCLTSCCTEKDCDQDNYPQIVVRYSGINIIDLNGKRIYVLDKETHELIDSVEFSNSDNHLTIDKWLMYDIFGDMREFKQYDYLLKLSNRQDSVTNIKYDRTVELIDCNSCFPVGDGSATITDFENLEFSINDVSYVESDTVVIESE